MKYIVTTQKGQPLKIGEFQFAISDVAVPANIDEATRFPTSAAAERAARKQMNLSAWKVVPLVPLDQQ